MIEISNKQQKIAKESIREWIKGEARDNDYWLQDLKIILLFLGILGAAILFIYLFFKYV